MKLQKKCNNKMANCGGETCNKCCQDPEGKGNCDKQDADAIKSEKAKGWISIIKKSSATFMYDDSDIRAIENLLTQMHARGILPKDILKVQIVRDGTPSIFTIVLNSRSDKLADRIPRMRVGRIQTLNSKDEGYSRYRRKAVHHYRKRYKGEGKS